MQNFDVINNKYTLRTKMLSFGTDRVLVQVAAHQASSNPKWLSITGIGKRTRISKAHTVQYILFGVRWTDPSRNTTGIGKAPADRVGNGGPPDELNN
jgi:hypothetical protein